MKTKSMTSYKRTALAAALLLSIAVAHADPCKMSIESNDVMQYSVREMVVPAGCTEVEVSLRHSGQLAAKIMGHDWVLARESDMPGIVNAGMAAGFKHGYLPENDKRIIAATQVVGGGETARVTFSTRLLQEGVRYVFFCTSPGHSSIMHGTFRFAGPRDLQGNTAANARPPDGVQ
jgi:azurin